MKVPPQIFLLALALVTPLLRAELGDTEDALKARYGEPLLRERQILGAQGKVFRLNSSLRFQQGDLRITCDVIDGSCVRITYLTLGILSEAQIQTILEQNRQGMAWTETSKPETAPVARTWRRDDGATGAWIRGAGIKLTSVVYQKAKEMAEAEAKAAIGREPKK